MRESSVYQDILEDGRESGVLLGRQEAWAEEARRIVLRPGTRTFGAPDAATDVAPRAVR